MSHQTKLYRFVEECEPTNLRLTVTLSPNDPLLTVITLGDVLRVEAVANDGINQAVDIVFVEIDVLVNIDRQVWRDSGACDNSSTDWVIDADRGNAWLIRCAGNNTGGSPNSDHSSIGTDGDDDGGDDDD